MAQCSGSKYAEDFTSGNSHGDPVASRAEAEQRWRAQDATGMQGYNASLDVEVGAAAPEEAALCEGAEWEALVSEKEREKQLAGETQRRLEEERRAEEEMMAEEDRKGMEEVRRRDGAEERERVRARYVQGAALGSASAGGMKREGARVVELEESAGGEWLLKQKMRERMVASKRVKGLGGGGGETPQHGHAGGPAVGGTSVDGAEREARTVLEAQKWQGGWCSVDASGGPGAEDGSRGRGDSAAGSVGNGIGCGKRGGKEVAREVGVGQGVVEENIDAMLQVMNQHADDEVRGVSMQGPGQERRQKGESAKGWKRGVEAGRADRRRKKIVPCVILLSQSRFLRMLPPFAYDSSSPCPISCGISLLAVETHANPASDHLRRIRFQP